MSELKVSIIICNYNYGSYIEDCIKSALAQTYKNIEVIVVDDGSTDDSIANIENFGGSINLIRKQNGGQISAYNVGFSASTGDIVFFLDSDDAYDLTLVEKVVRSFSSNVAKVHFGLRLFDESGKVISGRVPRVLEAGNFRDKIINQGYLYCSSPGSGNAYARWAIKDLFPLPTLESDKHGADFYLIYASALFGDVVAIDENIASYRVQSIKNADKGLIFGNSAQNGREPGRQLLRSNNFRTHILKISGGKIDVPIYLTSFPVEKVALVSVIFSAANYRKGLVAGCSRIPYFVGSLRNSVYFSSPEKLVLFLWAMLVIFLPRSIGFYLARYLSNAAAR